MITLNKTTVYTNDETAIFKYFYCGLEAEKGNIETTNGSRFLAVDSGKDYVYNNDNHTWTEMQTGGGGGGEPAQYLKTIVKDTTNSTITITDKSGNTTTFEYGGGIANKIVHLYTYTNGEKRLVGSEDLGEVA